MVLTYIIIRVFSDSAILILPRLVCIHLIQIVFGKWICIDDDFVTALSIFYVECDPFPARRRDQRVFLGISKLVFSCLREKHISRWVARCVFLGDKKRPIKMVREKHIWAMVDHRPDPEI